MVYEAILIDEHWGKQKHRPPKVKGGLWNN
jgi:hypothetical protein